MKWTMENLVKKTGVEARSIRYYVKLELIDKPDFRGPATAYTDKALIQIMAIKTLQDQGLNLELIKRQMVHWTIGDLQKLANGATISIVINQQKQLKTRSAHQNKGRFKTLTFSDLP